MHCLGDDFVDEADDGGTGLAPRGIVPETGDRPFSEGSDPLDDFFFVGLDWTDEYAGRDLDVVNQVEITGIGYGHGKNAGLLVVIQR